MVDLAQRRDDDGRRHPRDGLRPQGGEPGGVHGRRRRSSRRPPRRSSSQPRVARARDFLSKILTALRCPRTRTRGTRNRTLHGPHEAGCGAPCRRGTTCVERLRLSAAGLDRARPWPAVRSGGERQTTQGRRERRQSPPAADGGAKADRSRSASSSTSPASGYKDPGSDTPGLRRGDRPKTSPASSASSARTIEWVETAVAQRETCCRTARSTSCSRPTRSTTRRKQVVSTSPGRTSSPARTCWSRKDDNRSRAREDLKGKKVCSVTGRRR